MPTQAGDPSPDELLDMVRKAIKHLVARDSHLLRMKAAERSITHKLAEYLRCYLDDRFDLKLDDVPGISVDCEYNRYGDEAGTPKKLPLDGNLYVEGEPYYLANPDIIVHHRGDQAANWLVIEVKTFFNNRDAAVLLDKLKLVSYLGDPTGYYAGLFLDLGHPDKGDVLKEAKLITQKTLIEKGSDRVQLGGHYELAQDYYWQEGTKVVFTNTGGQAEFAANSDKLAEKLMTRLESAFGFTPIFGTK